MRILITGGTGLLGKALIENLNKRHYAIATYMGNYVMQDSDGIRYLNLDVRDHNEHVRIFQEFMPEVTIHTAGIGSPDYAEQHRDESWAIDFEGTRNILTCCKKVNSNFIFISSNGIYDGENAPYSEEDPAIPINFYGKLKLETERMVADAGIQYAIVRPILMYGWNHPSERQNIATYCLSRMRNGEKVFVYEDVFLTPLFSLSCAEAIWRIIENGKYDVFNIAGAERVSIYQMIIKMAAIFELNRDLIEPIKQGYFNELVKRPRDTSFNTLKMQKILGITPLSLYEGFAEMRASWKE
jgi:dTDP-4-dehydrorhamnose reductase